MTSRILRWALAVPVIAATGFGLGAATAAVAAPATVTAHTVVSNHPDGGNGGTWAYDDFGRTLTVSVASSQAGVPAGDTAYTASVTDKGQFNAVTGSLSPNQVTAGVKVTHAVKGAMNGGATYTLLAPSTDTLTGTVETVQDDNFLSPAGDKTTSDWPAQAFATPADVTVAYTNSGNGWSWSYNTACEKWTDAGTNGDGNLAGDGNITGKPCIVIPPKPPKPPVHPVPPVHPQHPYIYGGHIVSVNNNDVVLGWNYGGGAKFACTRTFGFNMSVNGSPHLGFTSADEGFWSGLAAGHTYDMEIYPCNAAHQQTGPTGWINLVTTR